MMAGIVAVILSVQAARHEASQHEIQAARHRAGQCECGVKVTSWTVTSLEPDDAWGGMRPRVTMRPDRIERILCPAARRKCR